MSTAAEQEAERLWGLLIDESGPSAFLLGWTEAEKYYRELLEAAREYREARGRSLELGSFEQENDAGDRLLTAAAALNEEGGD